MKKYRLEVAGNTFLAVEEIGPRGRYTRRVKNGDIFVADTALDPSIEKRMANLAKGAAQAKFIELVDASAKVVDVPVKAPKPALNASTEDLAKWLIDSGIAEADVKAMDRDALKAAIKAAEG